MADKPVGKNTPESKGTSGKTYAKSEPAASRLLAEIRSMQRPSRRTWFSDLLPEVQRELEAVRDAWQAGQLKHLPLNHISERCIESLGLNVSRHSVDRFIKGL